MRKGWILPRAALGQKVVLHACTWFYALFIKSLIAFEANLQQDGLQQDGVEIAEHKKTACLHRFLALRSCSERPQRQLSRGPVANFLGPWVLRKCSLLLFLVFSCSNLYNLDFFGISSIVKHPLAKLFSLFLRDLSEIKKNSKKNSNKTLIVADNHVYQFF